MAKDEYGEVVPYYKETLLWSDGSFAMDLPIARLKEIFNGKLKIEIKIQL